MLTERPALTKISILLSDVDGTLVTKDKLLTDATRRAVAALRARGILFAICSARPPRGMRMLIEPLRITTPIIAFNGGILATPDLAVIEQHRVAPDMARRAVDFMAAEGAQIWVFSGEDWLVRDLDNPRIALEQRSVQFPPTVVSEFGHALDAADKIVGVSNDFARLAGCEGAARALFGEDASVVRSQLYYLDITHRRANKGTALLTLAKLLAIPTAEIAVIGDGSNDVAMFTECGLSIAMGNAAPDIQQQAQFVTASNEDEGFAKAVERYVLDAEAGASA
jgi:Cof subfamily protein (haloacid dehalogenase superfamily)